MTWAPNPDTKKVPYAVNMDELTRLAVQARDGDGDALDAFVRRTQADVWRFCARLTDNQRADDLVQETFLRAWRSLPSFRADSMARTWLLGVASHVVADHIRRNARRGRLLGLAGIQITPVADPDVSQRPGNGVDRSDELGTLDLLNSLDLDQRAAFVLTQVIGCSYAETAEIVGVPVGPVRSRVARARGHLAEAVNHAIAQ